MRLPCLSLPIYPPSPQQQPQAQAFLRISKVSNTKAHDGLRRVEAANEGTYTLRKDEMVLNPKQRENFEKVVENTTERNGSGASGARPVIINMTTNIEAPNATPGVEKMIEERVMMSQREQRQQLMQDFANNGPIARNFGGRAA